jgi:REP element-mobilizing transposase RayT
MKYGKALALQRLESDPEGAFVDLKYHLAWNVKRRHPVFAQGEKHIDLLHSAFPVCSEEIGGLASLMYVASDHVHVYVQSNGEYSVEAIVQELKQLSQKALLTGFPDLEPISDSEGEIWDRAYFAETLG